MAGHRYIIYHNVEEENRDGNERESIVEMLEKDSLRSGCLG